MTPRQMYAELQLLVAQPDFMQKGSISYNAAMYYLIKILEDSKQEYNDSTDQQLRNGLVHGYFAIQPANLRTFVESPVFKTIGMGLDPLPEHVKALGNQKLYQETRLYGKPKKRGERGGSHVVKARRIQKSCDADNTKNESWHEQRIAVLYMSELQHLQAQVGEATTAAGAENVDADGIRRANAAVIYAIACSGEVTKQAKERPNAIDVSDARAAVQQIEKCRDDTFHSAQDQVPAVNEDIAARNIRTIRLFDIHFDRNCIRMHEENEGPGHGGAHSLVNVEKEAIGHYKLYAELEKTAKPEDRASLRERYEVARDVAHNDKHTVSSAMVGSEPKEKHTVTLIPEMDHLTQHGDNIHKLISQIEMGVIKQGTTIYIERKQEGDSFGMRDVIFLAEMITLEKEGKSPIKIPEKLKSSPIYYDALLRNAAKEKGIIVAGMEGKDLDVDKKSPEQHDQARETFTVTTLADATSQGPVICLAGEAHMNPLAEGLNEKGVEVRVAENAESLVPTTLREELSEEVGKLQRSFTDNRDQAASNVATVVPNQRSSQSRV